MGAPKRVRIEPTDDWEQLRLRVQSPEQEADELLRPIVLFGQTAAERAQATSTSQEGSTGAATVATSRPPLERSCRRGRTAREEQRGRRRFAGEVSVEGGSNRRAQVLFHCPIC